MRWYRMRPRKAGQKRASQRMTLRWQWFWHKMMRESLPRRLSPHGLSNRDFDALFTTDRPIIFAYHGYPWLIHRLTYRRTNHGNLHVRGYKEEGTTSTPFDMVVRNDLDRFHLVADVAERVESLANVRPYIRQRVRDKLVEHGQYIVQHGIDMPEVANWNWTY